MMATRAPMHHSPGWQSDADRRKAYDDSKQRHYTKRRWYHLRKAYLATHPLCECECNCGGVATVVDHRQPHHGDDALMYAWDNLRAMTKPCHDRKTATHDGGFGNPASRADRMVPTS
jgi:5-methylcytosine-specific restriction protein A